MYDLKSRSKVMVKKALFHSKLYTLNKLTNRCYIIMYHMVPETPTGFYAEVSKRDFETHIAYLAANYNIISLTDYVRKVKNNEPLKGCVVITFDDGFLDNYTNAYPILKKYNVPATIFLLAGRIEDGKPPWFIKFRYMFLKTTKLELNICIANQEFNLPLGSMVQKKEASTHIMLFLQKLEDTKRVECFLQVEEALGVKDYSEIEHVMMSWNNVCEMADNKIDFGAHTINHPVLSRLSFSSAEDEIAASKEMIENKIGRKANTFAYPFGKKDQYKNDTIKILKRLSFECSVTTEPAPADHKSNLFEIPRYFQGQVRLHDFFWEPHS